MNLFIGVIMYHFIKSQKIKYLTESQQKWIDLQKIIIELKPTIIELIPPKSKIRKIFYIFITHKYFDFTILFIIIINSVVLMIDYEGCPVFYTNILEQINFIIAMLFIIEAISKIVALGYKQYLYNNWNRLDLTVVIFSFFDLISQTVLVKYKFLKFGDKMIRSLRLLRIIRVLKLMKSLDEVQRLINTLFISIPKILNILSLILLILFIYTILGCFLFQNIKKGYVIDDYINFKNFFHGVMTLFKVSTSDQWSLILLDVMKEKSKI